jgi:hypothetical protein
MKKIKIIYFLYFLLFLLIILIGLYTYIGFQFGIGVSNMGKELYEVKEELKEDREIPLVSIENNIIITIDSVGNVPKLGTRIKLVLFAGMHLKKFLTIYQLNHFSQKGGGLLNSPKTIARKIVPKIEISI